jgi:hypothetical protein
LYPLEVNYESNETESTTDQESEIVPVRRSTRTAAVVGNQRRQLIDQWINEMD